MRTTKELLSSLSATRWVAHGPDDSTKDGTKENRKVVYFVLTDKIEEAREQYILLAKSLNRVMEYADSKRRTGPSPDEEGKEPSACTVHLSSQADAKKAAQFLADIYGFWRGKHSEPEDIAAYHVHDNMIRCEIDHVCFYFDPNGFMDFDLKKRRVGQVLTIDKDQHQFAKRYIDVLSRLSDHGIAPDWPYDKEECELIWKTHQARATLLHLFLSICSDKKPHPKIQKTYQVFTFIPDGGDFDILMDGQPLLKFTRTARRAVVALALQTDLDDIKMKDFCYAYDEFWTKAKSGSKNIPKKFSQAMQSLRRILPGVFHEALGAGRARVFGVNFEGKPSAAKLRKQLHSLQRASEK